jgi:hypothetical protein
MSKSKKKKTAAKKRPSAPLKSAAKQATSHAWTQQSAKLYQLPFAQTDVNKATKDLQSMTENAVKASTDFMQQFFGADATKAFAQYDPSKLFAQFADAAKGGEKAFAFGKDAGAQLQKSAQGATKAVNEAVELSRENAEAAMECGNIAVSVSKNISAELINYANKAFAQNVELSKQIFNCRTLNDMFDLSSKFFKSNLDSFFNESVKVSELAFAGASEISEPLNERFSETTERFVKAVAA